MVIAEATRAGVVHAAEKDMITGVMRLADRPVRSIMTPRREVVWLDVLAPADELRRRILEAGRSRYLLARGTLDNLVGVALAQDLLRDLAEKGEIDVESCAHQPLIVPGDLSALRLLERFRRDRNHFAVVVSEFGLVQGVATPTDVLEAIAGDLPEPGESPPAGEREADGAWLFDGEVQLARVSQATGASLPESESYTTLAGYVLSELGRLPQPGETFDGHGLRFEVVSLDGPRIEKIRVRHGTPPESEPAAAETAH